MVKAGKCFSIVVVLALVLSLGAMALPLAGEVEAQPVEVWVDDDWAGLSYGEAADGHTFGITAFATIQDGVDAVAEGGMVHVADGIYTENVDVNRSVTIQSENGADSTIVQAADPNDHVFEVTTHNVTIGGFTVENATGEEKAGIYLHEVESCTTSHNNRGIHVGDDGDLIANYNNVEENDVIGIYKENPPSIDAINNWWGDASGPPGAGSGTSDAVSDNVDCEPCLSELWGARANAGVSHRHAIFTDADSVDANVPLDWSYQWLLSIHDPTVDLTNPYITLTSGLPFVSFSPEPVVIDPSTVQWVTPYMPAGTDFPCHAIEGEGTFPPGVSLSKSVSPQKLVDEVTLQTVTATFTLEEAADGRNMLTVHIGFLPCVSPSGLPDEAVTSVYHSGASDTGPWEFHGNVDDRVVWWSANPSEVEIGKTYQLTATFKSTRSPEFGAAPFYKPRVSTEFCKDIPWPDVFGSSTTIDYEGVSVTFGADEEITWNRGVTDLRRSIILEAVYLTDIKQETTEPGEYIVDAKTEADTEVIKSGSGTPTVTIAKYSNNPGTHLSGDMGKYIDVHIDDATDVTEIEIRLYYTDAQIAGLDESSLSLCWWDGSDWPECSDTGVNLAENYMWAKIRNDTDPSLSELTGTPFAGFGQEAETWYVDDDRADYPAANFTKIQDAVDAAAAGDTIIVYPGTYPENVDVNRSLTIQSENGSANCVVQAADSSDHVFEVTANNVSISGFTVKGATGNYTAGIHLDHAAHCDIFDNNSCENSVGIILANSGNNALYNNTALENAWGGIGLESSHENIISNNMLYSDIYGISLNASSLNRIENNTAYNNIHYWDNQPIGTGISLTWSDNNAVLHNEVRNNNYGIMLWYASNNAVNNNTAENNTAESPPPGGAGILVGGSNNIMRDNQVSKNDIGIEVMAQSPYAPDMVSINNTIADNNVSSNNLFGIVLSYNASENIVISNTANLNVRSGILVYSSSNNTITNNTASENSDGIHLSDWSDHNVIMGNTANSNTVNHGIWLAGSHNNTVINNTANSNNEGGICLDYSNHNLIENNTANENSHSGIQLLPGGQPQGSYNNTVINNTANWNKEGGICLESSSSNTLTSNTANSNKGDGIHLHDSSDNTLTNNANENNEVGICLDHSSNNTLTSNTVNSNKGDGIHLHDSSDNTLTNNANENNEGGIGLDHSSNNTLESNTVNSNKGDGIHLHDSSDNALTNNNANENNEGGICLDHSSNNILESNTVNWNKGGGIHLHDSSDNSLTNNNASSNEGGIALDYSSNNTITNNIVDSNDKGGIHLHFSSDNTITNNNASNNDLGIDLDSSNNNAIYLNNFIDNAGNVYSSDSSNAWNSPEKMTYTYKGNQYTSCLGNHWSDYAGSDADGDGIGDTSYPIDSDEDAYPLMEPFENYPTWSPWNYDKNGSGYIEIGELLAAINDYIGGEITISQLLQLINLYISHTQK